MGLNQWIQTQMADSATDIEGSGIPFSSPFDEDRDISSLWETETNKALQRGNRIGKRDYFFHITIFSHLRSLLGKFIDRLFW